MVSSLPDRITLDHAAETLTALSDFLEPFLDQWEACDGTAPPSIASHLPAAGDLRRIALSEMIKIDLEYRWLRHNFPRSVEDYAAEFPELSEGGLPVDLIYEEFHIRRQSGLNVDPQDFVARFPDRAEELRRLLGVTQSGTTTSIARGVVARKALEMDPGETIDDFDLLARLGKGAFASVYLARQRSMQRLVALKVSADHGTEPQTLAQLDHDYIVRVFDLRSLPERKIRLLYMQYLPGGTLQNTIELLRETAPQERSGRVLLRAIDRSLENRGEMPPAAGESPVRDFLAACSWPEAVCWIGERLAEALEYAHRHGVLHRDVKPANVLLTATGAPKLADFNVSFGSSVSGATPEAFFGGSLAYMSPEQIEAFSPTHPRRPDSLDGRADFYSLGVMLWELLTGYRPFIDEQFEGNWARTLEAMLARRNAGVTNEMRETLPRNCPAGLIRVLTRSLAPDPDARWQTGSELARQLKVCGNAEAEHLVYPPEQSRRLTLRRYAVAAVLLLAIVPNGIAGFFNYLYNDGQVKASGIPEHIAMFQPLQLTINALAYPIGLWWLGWLAHSVSTRLRATESDSRASREQWQTLSTRALLLGHVAGIVGVALWAFCGILYPVLLHLISGKRPSYEDFMGSLFFCGLIAASYPFFCVTIFSVQCLLPSLLQSAPSETVRKEDLDRVGKLAWLYFILAGAVPLLGVTILGIGISLLGANPSGPRAKALGGLGVGGLIGLLALYPALRRVQADLATLRAISSEK